MIENQSQRKIDQRRVRTRSDHCQNNADDEDDDATMTTTMRITKTVAMTTTEDDAFPLMRHCHAVIIADTRFRRRHCCRRRRHYLTWAQTVNRSRAVSPSVSPSVIQADYPPITAVLPA